MLYKYVASILKQGGSPRWALIDVLKILQTLLQDVLGDPDLLRNAVAARAKSPAEDPELDDLK